MPGPNRVAKGLLGTLDMKNGGQTPSSSSEGLAFTMDIGPNYLADIPLEFAVASVSNPNVLQFVATLEVPAGELWYLYALCAETLVVVVNEFSVAYPALVPPIGGQPIPIKTDGGYWDTTASIRPTSTIQNTWMSAVPLLLSSGTELGCFISREDAGDVGSPSAFTRAMFRRVQV